MRDTTISEEICRRSVTFKTYTRRIHRLESPRSTSPTTERDKPDGRHRPDRNEGRPESMKPHSTVAPPQRQSPKITILRTEFHWSSRCRSCTNSPPEAHVSEWLNPLTTRPPKTDEAIPSTPMPLFQMNRLGRTATARTRLTMVLTPPPASHRVPNMLGYPDFLPHPSSRSNTPGTYERRGSNVNHGSSTFEHPHSTFSLISHPKFNRLLLS